MSVTQPNVPNCNSTVNGVPYYDPQGGETVESKLSMPVLLSCIAMSTCFVALFGYNANSQLQQSGWSIWTICLIFLTICCCFSCARATYDTTQTNNGPIPANMQHPCYSMKDKKIIS